MLVQWGFLVNLISCTILVKKKAGRHIFGFQTWEGGYEAFAAPTSGSIPSLRLPSSTKKCLPCSAACWVPISAYLCFVSSQEFLVSAGLPASAIYSWGDARVPLQQQN